MALFDPPDPPDPVEEDASFACRECGRRLEAGDFSVDGFCDRKGCAAAESQHLREQAADAVAHVDDAERHLARIAEIVERAEKKWDGGFLGITYADTYEILRLAKGE